MNETATTERSTEDEQRLREGIAIANIPTLLLVLAHMTGDRRWLAAPYRPTRTRGLDDNHDGGLAADVQAEIRRAALVTIAAWREGRLEPAPPPTQRQLVQMLGVSMGERVPPEYAPMIEDELAAGTGHEPDVPHLDVPAGFEVLVIGAGVSGIAAGVELGAAGIPYAILEKRETVGGTWLENRYPGCGVDTPSALYSFSFAPNDWSQYFALRDELHDYLERVARDNAVVERIRFQTEVLSMAWDETAQRWQVRVRTAGGAEESLSANLVISAVGAFTRPKMPSIAGLERFDGPCVHTARWPAELDLAGRRVAVIGNGASAMQLVPAIAGTAAQVTVFQRSPQWAAPFDQYHLPVPEPVRFLGREVPLYRAWYRVRSSWTFNDKVHPTLQKDPDWPHPERAVNAANDGHRKFFTRYIAEQLGARPDLMRAVTPGYPPFGKRILLDNGWYRALTRDDVELVTQPIREVTEGGVVSADGELHEADVLVCATGFDVVRFLAPIEIHGRSGETLRDAWDDDDARAYLGLAVPDFPNFFILFGPNTQTGHGGSLIGSAEIQLHYVLDMLQQMLRAGIGSVEVRRDVYESYNARVDAAHERMVWTHPGMDTYYRNSRGRVVVNNPFRVVDYWHMTRSGDLADYVIEPRHEPGGCDR
ncbi:NAD(P)/FAD-dependent oxidoreductase [Conexibacter sp. CPCC 206217]|uniref:flavin-containing monooxygenase n=1 Tax=Conexibacter sp. CPCC 206217 TaxID=3064574 RepID=UPI00271715A9|nr:NAD(P)/FAD-dependent oxidoreductase [Conexibacter sp. CPCC 206217]MDO8211088.1 NAD(P)/FAD-dependent oxidoreductase [Conexibacter sp. CPCC 206217]